MPLLRRRSISGPDMAYHYRPGVVARTGGSYDLAGIWRPATFGPHTIHFNDHAYDRSLHSYYYNLEDDYYGSYGDLLEFEAALRRNRHLGEEERLRRWRMRLAFEELEEAERLRRYRAMAETDRILLGLSDHSWWGERYGSQPFHQRPNWRSRFGNKIRRWEASFLPLSSTLTSRYAPVWGGAVDDLARNERRLDSQLQRAENQIYTDRLLGSERALHDLHFHQLHHPPLAHHPSHLRDRLEHNALREQERALEARLMDEALYDQERRYDREVLHDHDRRLERHNEEILYDQERMLENQERVLDNLTERNEDMLYDRERSLSSRLEEDAMLRADQRLDHSTSFPRTAELLDRDPVGYGYDSYPDYVDGDLVAEEIGNELERDRYERDLLY